MTNLIKKILGIGALGLALSGNSYSQKTEQTEDGYKQYNEKGQVIREKIKKGSQIDLLDFKYDKQGRKIKEISKRTYENYKKLYEIEQSNFKYDEQGRIIERINTEDYTQNYGTDDNEEYEKFHLVERWTYIYDKLGKKIESKMFVDLDGDDLIDKNPCYILRDADAEPN